jgi:glucose/mannose-6-phosphate isomerase
MDEIITVMILDRPDDIRRVDKSGMLDVLDTIPCQIEEGIAIGKKFKLSSCNINKIVIVGMGGSAFTGDVIFVLGRKRISFPLVVSKTYSLPLFVDEKTLVMVLSYSGDSEEAISAFRTAKEKKAQIFSISSGGLLEKISSKANWYTKIPSGLQPRAAVAYLLFPSLVFLSKSKLFNIDEKEFMESLKVIKELKNMINQHVPTQKNLAKRLAQDLQGKIPKIYGYGITAPIARRWRTQFNENTKLFAFSDEVPECNHNEIESWNGKKPYHYLFLRSKNEIPEVKKRFLLMKELVENITELWTKGESPLAQMIYLMYLGDYVSTYLAILRGIDPSPVHMIETIKKRLRLLSSAK